MNSLIRTPDEYVDLMLTLASNKPLFNDTRPTNFINIMEKHLSSAKDIGRDGLPLKNPLIVALGDSVTAGAFEDGVFDSENVYHEKFRRMLANQYRRTTVSVINAGIGTDNVVGMQKRLERDVIRYQPDLVIINAVLNGPADLTIYQAALTDIVDRITANTMADIILMTPNLVLRGNIELLSQRVDVVRGLAVERNLCLADAFAVWEQFDAYHIKLEDMLANGINHPTTLGHQVFALELMKLFT